MKLKFNVVGVNQPLSPSLSLYLSLLNDLINHIVKKKTLLPYIYYLLNLLPPPYTHHLNVNIKFQEKLGYIGCLEYAMKYNNNFLNKRTDLGCSGCRKLGLGNRNKLKIFT